MLDADDLDTIAVIPVGGEPSGVAVHPDGTRVYTPNLEDDTVSVISTISNTVVATVAVGRRPYALGRFIGGCPGAADDCGADGLADGVDDCPSLANAGQADGDGDGVGDVCDNCPAVANAGQADANQNGVGDACACGDWFVDADEQCDDGPSGSVCCTAGCVATMSPCDDGDLCTTGDTCQAGACAGTPVACLVCDTCDPGSGACVATPRTGCEQSEAPFQGKLVVKASAGGSRDLVSWSWRRGSVLALQ